MYDLCVIGSGPAGEKAAAHAAYFGFDVVMVERSALLGGAVVSNAGIPTKTLRETAGYLTGIHRREVYGVGLDLDVHVVLELLHRRTHDVTATMAAQVADSMKRHGVRTIHGTARVAGPSTVEVETASGAETVEARSILIATGSRPSWPPWADPSLPGLMNSESIVGMPRPFRSIVVIGGGPVGCEYASVLNALGASVTIIDVAPRLISMADPDASVALAQSFTRAGVTILTQQGPEAVVQRDDGVELLLETGQRLSADAALVAVGRRANTDGLGLEALGVAMTPNGEIVVDDQFRSSAATIYAAGDVVGAPRLASVSAEQGRLAASAACGTDYVRARRHPLSPYAVYSLPEVAWVGLTEPQAVAANVPYEVGTTTFAGNSRATISGFTDGLIKLIFDPSNRRLLGAHAVGEMAGEIIHLAHAVIEFGGDIEYFVHLTFNVPSWSEAFKLAAFDGLGKLEPGGLIRADRRREG